MTKITVDINLGAAIDTMSEKTLRLAVETIMNQMLADMNQYVPYKDNPLRMSAHISDDRTSLVWSTPYAKAQFYGRSGKRVFREYTTPGTGPRWDLVATGNHMRSWERVYKNALGL